MAHGQPAASLQRKRSVSQQMSFPERFPKVPKSKYFYRYVLVKANHEPSKNGISCGRNTKIPEYGFAFPALLADVKKRDSPSTIHL